MTIYKNSSPGNIRIEIPNKNINAKYSKEQNRFIPITYSIKVSSKDGTSIRYRIKLNSSQHYCQVDGNELDIDGVTAKLDGYLFKVGDVSRIYIPAVTTTYTHLMQVDFPLMTRKKDDETCYGTFILTVEGVV